MLLKAAAAAAAEDNLVARSTCDNTTACVGCKPVRGAVGEHALALQAGRRGCEHSPCRCL